MGSADRTLGAELRAAGLRATPARLAVLRLVRKASTPPSHGEIALAASSFGRATLYRCLLDLERAGLVRRTQLGSPVWRFEDAQRKHGIRSHPHFLCSACGKMVCLPPIAIEVGEVAGLRRALHQGGFEVQLRGRCDACSGARDRRRREPR